MEIVRGAECSVQRVLSRQKDRFSRDSEVPFMTQEINGQSVEMEVVVVARGAQQYSHALPYLLWNTCVGTALVAHMHHVVRRLS